MAIYRCEVKNISRGQGRSVVAAAAYRSGERLFDERQGRVCDYVQRHGIESKFIDAPPEAPLNLKTDRGRLWNAVDAAERRSDARTARELILALPRELDPLQRLDLVGNFVRQHVVARGLVADVAIHKPRALDGGAQPHAHVLISTRTLGPAGFSKTKDRAFSDTPEAIAVLRSAWADAVNEALEGAGLVDRVDHRSLADRGIDRPPEPKIGPVAMQVHLAGRRAYALEKVKRLRAARQDLEAYEWEVKRIEAELAHLERETPGITARVREVLAEQRRELRAEVPHKRVSAAEQLQPAQGAAPSGARRAARLAAASLDGYPIPLDGDRAGAQNRPVWRPPALPVAKEQASGTDQVQTPPKPLPPTPRAPAGPGRRRKPRGPERD